MDWFFLAALSAVIFVFIAVLSKELMKDISPTFFTGLTMALSTVFYLPVFLYYFSASLIPSITVLTGFIALSLLTNFLGYFSYNYALKNDPVSEVMPLNRLQPVFVAVIGFIFLNEAVDILSAAGILLATFGGYIVLLKNPHHLLSPFQNILSDRGEQFAVLSAAAFGFAAVTDRYITTQIPPEIHSFFVITGIAVLFNIWMFKTQGIDYLHQSKKEVLDNTVKYLIIGLLQALSFLTILSALSQAEASKVIPVLQLQVPLTVLAGGALFNEDHILLKLIGSAILVIGVTLVAI